MNARGYKLNRQSLLSTDFSRSPSLRFYSAGLIIGITGLAVLMLLAAENIYGQSSADALFIDKSGRVGIGNRTPEAELDVSGRVKAAAFAGTFTGRGAVPIGVIVMWSGSPDKLPEGWALCDGRQVKGRQTPNLKGRFIVGYDPEDPEYNDQSNPIGGVKRHRLTVDEMPAHQHPGSTNEAKISFDKTSWTGSTHGLAAAGKRGTINKKHDHRFVTDAVGAGKDHENRPPYYVLAYIMFIGE